MSHFSVFVIGNDPEYQLAPFHEYECTGRDDEFVVDVDITDEAAESFERSTETRLRSPDGSLHNPFTEAGEFKSGFSKESCDNPLQILRRELLVPDGWAKVQCPTKDYQTLASHVENYHGGFMRDGRAFRRTNPNKRWDWYQIGGRYSGRLKLKAGGHGLEGERSWTNRNDEPKAGWCDQARVDAIDFAGMRTAAEAEAASEYDRVMAAAGSMWDAWDAVRERHGKNIDAARAEYNGQPQLKRLRDAKIDCWDCDDYLLPRDRYIARAGDRSCRAFVVVKNRQWYERGSMGWWGMVSDEKDEGEWSRKCAELLAGLPGDTVLTVVDCHI